MIFARSDLAMPTVADNHPAKSEQQDRSEEANTIVAVSHRERIAFVDVAKGIGILLVVMGHCLGGLYDAKLIGQTSLAWLAFYFIYCFHMPLFFFLTGSLVEARVTTSPKRFIKSSLTRIAYPYVLWGSIQSIILASASGLTNHHVKETIFVTLLQILWVPLDQFWFLYVLFFLHMLAVFTIWLGGRLLLVLSFAALYVLCAVWQPAADFVWSYVAGTNILFYLLGVCFGGSFIGRHDRIEHSYFMMSIAILSFIGSAWTGWSTQASFYSYATLPAAIAGTALILLIARSDRLSDSWWLSQLGRLSMPIYLLHVLFAAGTRIVLVKVLYITNIDIVLPVIFLAGVSGPLVVTSVVRYFRLQTAVGLG